MNSREEILNCANIEYRSIFISGADAEGFGTTGFNNYNCLINYNFNFEGVTKIAMRKFMWVGSYPQGYQGSYEAFIASNALTQWDIKHFQNSSRLGSTIFDVIPIAAAQYTPTYPPNPSTIFVYEPINLNWHYFSANNTINFIDFKLLAYDGNIFPVDTTIPNNSTWSMEILCQTRPANNKVFT